jgi:uncharacterized protein YjlB
MRLETWVAPPGDVIPNHPRFEVLLYRGVDVADVRARLAEHGWGGSWVNGVFAFHHFHSTSHEVLAVIAGRARLELGGPQGQAFDVATGDVVVLPAGTGHRRASASGDFRVPGGIRADHARGRRCRAGADRRGAAAGRRSGGRRGRGALGHVRAASRWGSAPVWPKITDRP